MFVDYLRKCGLHLSLIHCKICLLNNAMYMNLNGHTTQHLEIFINSESGTKCTLYELLCRNNQTFYGQRLMRQWITKPLFDIKQIHLRQNGVKYLKNLRDNECMIDNEWLLQLIRKLSVSKDLERRLRIIQCKKCPPKLF
eukprot:313670_1